VIQVNPSPSSEAVARLRLMRVRRDWSASERLVPALPGDAKTRARITGHARTWRLGGCPTRVPPSRARLSPFVRVRRERYARSAWLVSFGSTDW